MDNEPQSTRFNYAEFRTQLAMLDLQLLEIMRRLNASIRSANEKEIIRYSVKKNQITDAIFKYLANAYVETDGEIMDMPEFNPECDRHLNLQLPYRGFALWIEALKRLKERAEDAQEQGDAKKISEYVEHRVDETI